MPKMTDYPKLLDLPDGSTLIADSDVGTVGILAENLAKSLIEKLTPEEFASQLKINLLEAKAAVDENGMFVIEDEDGLKKVLAPVLAKSLLDLTNDVDFVEKFKIDSIPNSIGSTTGDNVKFMGENTQTHELFKVTIVNLAKIMLSKMTTADFMKKIDVTSLTETTSLDVSNYILVGGAGGSKKFSINHLSSELLKLVSFDTLTAITTTALTSMLMIQAANGTVNKMNILNFGVYLLNNIALTHVGYLANLDNLTTTSNAKILINHSNQKSNVVVDFDDILVKCLGEKNVNTEVSLGSSNDISPIFLMKNGTKYILKATNQKNYMNAFNDDMSIHSYLGVKNYIPYIPYGVEFNNFSSYMSSIMSYGDYRKKNIGDFFNGQIIVNNINISSSIATSSLILYPRCSSALFGLFRSYNTSTSKYENQIGVLFALQFFRDSAHKKILEANFDYTGNNNFFINSTLKTLLNNLFNEFKKKYLSNLESNMQLLNLRCTYESSSITNTVFTNNWKLLPLTLQGYKPPNNNIAKKFDIFNSPLPFFKTDMNDYYGENIKIHTGYTNINEPDKCIALYIDPYYNSINNSYKKIESFYDDKIAKTDTNYGIPYIYFIIGHKS